MTDELGQLAWGGIRRILTIYEFSDGSYDFHDTGYDKEVGNTRIWDATPPVQEKTKEEALDLVQAALESGPASHTSET